MGSHSGKAGTRKDGTGNGWTQEDTIKMFQVPAGNMTGPKACDNTAEEAEALLKLDQTTHQVISSDQDPPSDQDPLLFAGLR